MYKRLKELRLKNNITLQKMSNLLGLKKSTSYQRKEDGERKFSVEEAKIVAKFFNKSVEEIFFKD